MMASATTIANVTATLAPTYQSIMSSQIVTARSAQRRWGVAREGRKKGFALPVSVRVGNAKPSTAAAG